MMLPDDFLAAFYGKVWNDRLFTQGHPIAYLEKRGDAFMAIVASEQRLILMAPADDDRQRIMIVL